MFKRIVESFGVSNFSSVLKRVAEEVGFEFIFWAIAHPILRIKNE
jgi:hypothetical protein